MTTLLLLPAQTAPPDEAFKRRHHPRSIGQDYSVFRDCLRWEFGFSCSICLLHERDILSYGAEGWGVMQVEHLVARSQNKSMAGVYINVIYICRLCNGARSDTENEDAAGRRLLDPTCDVWSAHFRVEGDRIVPREGDADAEYTADVYDINDPRRVKLRRRRRERRADFLAELLPKQKRLGHLRFREECGDPEQTESIALAKAEVEEAIARLVRLADQGAWVPEDAPVKCRCGRSSARSLPPAFERQVVRLDVP